MSGLAKRAQYYEAEARQPVPASSIAFNNTELFLRSLFGYRTSWHIRISQCRRQSYIDRWFARRWLLRDRDDNNVLVPLIGCQL